MFQTKEPVFSGVGFCLIGCEHDVWRVECQIVELTVEVSEVMGRILECLERIYHL
jgi:hypothetical protein